MEFLLPVALKLFPNMLPSTFEDKFAAVRPECYSQSTGWELNMVTGGETAKASSRQA